MIPNKKKSPQEITALRSQLGIPEIPAKESPTEQQVPDILPKEPIRGEIPRELVELEEPVFQLKLPPIPAANQIHKLPIHQHPIINTPPPPNPQQIQKPRLPTQRHNEAQIAELRRRELLAQLSSSQPDHTRRLKSLAAHPLIIVLTYIPAIAAPISVWQKCHHLIPISLLACSTLLTFYLFFAKKRSSHHAAFVIIINIMTIAFGSNQYPDLFPYAP